jgi:hypothetical protein
MSNGSPSPDQESGSPVPGGPAARPGTGARVVRIFLERSSGLPVKRCVGQVRVILVSFLPAFWLIASLPGPVWISATAVRGGAVCLILKVQQRENPRAGATGAGQSTVLRTASRGKAFTAADDGPAPETVASNPSIPLIAKAVTPTCAPAALALAQSWQFCLRAAPLPRAPSSAS